MKVQYIPLQAGAPAITLPGTDFENFVWHNFGFGDVVWFEDSSLDAPAARYLGITINDQIDEYVK